jgi:hypothetical protein
MHSAFRLRVLAFISVVWTVPSLWAAVPIVQSGQPQAVIMTRPNAPGYIQLAAQELQAHVQKMSGAVLPLATVGSEATYPGSRFVYVGVSAATNAAGISTSGMELEHYILRTIGSNAYLVGRDGGDDQWWDLTDCQPGTLFGVYHLLGEILKVRWLWPGDSGTFVPQSANVTIPDLNLTTGPAMVQRKYRTPRIGLYLNGADTYGFGVPVLPESDTRKQELAYEELLWLRRLRMGTRKSPAFAHSFTQWWSLYGSTHPEYFAELLPGRTQPHPAPDRVKLHDSSEAVWLQRISDWVAAGAGNSVNICPNDSRSFCVCSSCLAWDRPSQTPEVVFSSSEARLSDRLARFYTEIANRVAPINPNALVYGYAYDVYRYAPLEANLPGNVALAYVPGATSAMALDGIASTEADVLGWIAHGCQHMYLRPNWMLSAHAGPCWPTRRLGEHFKRLLAPGNIKGFDSDSSCSSYASFGLYYYLVCRLIADPTLSVDAILDEYCSGFGSAAAKVRDYFTYWEHFLYNQADAGNNDIIGWASCVPAYGSTYRDTAFDGALQILDTAYATLGAGETAARARLDFLKVACLHGRLTAQAIALVDPGLTLANNPKAAQAMRALLNFRNQYAESFAIWREWMIDRESFVPGMEAYWTAILANPDTGNQSNVGAFIETGGQVVMEAEHCTATKAGTGTAAGLTWEDVGVVNVGTSPAIPSSGTSMQALPNSGVATDNGTNGPRLDFKVDFHTTGTYYIFIHMPTHLGTDDSINIGLDGVLIASNLQNTSGSWRWRTTTPTTLGLNISTPGVRTFNIWMREDGVIVDKIVLTTNSAIGIPSNDPGPAESGKRGTAEYPLTVINGTGDGSYGASTILSITADTAQVDHVFDRWTGATALLGNVLAPTTTVTTPAQASQVTATYKLAPSVDTEGDGMLDAWEIAHFGSTGIATAVPASDADLDGYSDLEEFFAGTDPLDPQSHLRLALTRNASGALVAIWDAVAGKTYRMLSKSALGESVWTPLSIGITGAAPVCQLLLPLDTSRRFLRIQVE